MIIIYLVLLGFLLPHLSFSASVKVGIVNGTEARPHSRPYMVSIQKDGRHVCGGFLISSQFVLTAAHCKSDGALTVLAGVHDLTKKGDTMRFCVKSYYQQADLMILEVANVKLMSDDVCQRQWGQEYLNSQMMCVYGYGGSCKGDSGGPLVCGDTAVGVTYFVSMYNCNDPDRFNVYTKISAFLSWIKKITRRSD
ncbi:serine protease 57-like [Triplophysa dalaica]|uniref:serine protease 57-like n=1 Tax=Triplophysa dalaica TaxID=1582913 RepID=UPI0024DF6978|nr:serine protease 57-like [Triplophysa dalaica]XP_056615624.1 serine protease 57-like [Triplophysa dalaica]